MSSSTPDRRRLSRYETAGLIAAVALAVAVNAFLLLRDDDPRVIGADDAVGTLEVLGAQAAAEDQSGPGLTEPGVTVRVRTHPSGVIEVTEWLRSLEPVESLALQLPVSSPAPGVLTDLTVHADGTPVEVDVGQDATALPTGTTRVVVRYRVLGAMMRSEPAPPGRALVGVEPLTPEAVGDGTVVVRFAGPGIRNVTCPELEGGDQLCGRQVDGAWRTVAMPPGPVYVSAQLDLTDPSELDDSR